MSTAGVYVLLLLPLLQQSDWSLAGSSQRFTSRAHLDDSPLDSEIPLSLPSACVCDPFLQEPHTQEDSLLCSEDHGLRRQS